MNKKTREKREIHKEKIVRKRESVKVQKKIKKGREKRGKEENEFLC